MENDLMFIRGKLLQKGFTLADIARKCGTSRQLVRYALGSAKGRWGEAILIKKEVERILNQSE
jgi:hypothetical protein